MTLKMFTTCAAAVAAVGAAAAGATALASSGARPGGTRRVQRAARPAAARAGPAAAAEPATAVRRVQPRHRPRRGLRDQSRPGGKRNPASEGHVADHDLRKAFRNGNFPEQFAVSNIQPVPGNGVKADVAITGPKFAGPVEKTLVFIDQGGTWVLQHDAALALVQAATAVN